MENKLQKLSEKFNLENEKIEKIKNYISFLNEENKSYNLTGFKNEDDILSGNIEDALFGTISESIKNSKYIADIGTGAGIPGLILAIKYPEKFFYLVEVQKKRILFLEKALNLLKIENCKIVDFDYKTLLRREYFKIDCFITRASLKLEELFFIFSDSSKYYKKELIYWGSKNWKISVSENSLKFLKIKEYKYELENKERSIIEFKKR